MRVAHPEFLIDQRVLKARNCGPDDVAEPDAVQLWEVMRE